MAFQGTMLAIEAQQVIALRLTKMAMGGPAAQKEAELMVSDKLNAMAERGKMMIMGALGGKQDPWPLEVARSMGDYLGAEVLTPVGRVPVWLARVCVRPL